MKITFLGTGTSQGIPVIGCDCDVCQSNNPHDNRLRTSLSTLRILNISLKCGTLAITSNILNVVLTFS